MELNVLSKSTAGSAVESSLDARHGTKDDIFVQSFEDWVTRFGTTKESMLESTFVDENGVCRYKDNWEIYQITDQRKLEADTGCVDVTITKSESKPTAVGTVTVNFLTNFRTSWNYFESSPTDELARYAPLFKLYISLYCHKRTSQLVVLLGVYWLVLQIIIDVAYPVFPPFYRLINYLDTVLQVGVYLALVVLFRGSMFPDEIDELLPPGESHRKETPTSINQPHQKLGCFHYLKEALFRSSAEAKRLYEYKRHAPTTHSAAESQVPFYNALNIALKFLTKHGAHKNGSVKLDTPRHNLKLLFIFFLVPVYMILTNYASPLGPYLGVKTLCQANGQDSTICVYFTALFAWSWGYTIPVLLKILFACTVLLAMVGLALGAEVGRGLVDCWINRFGCLRILDADGKNSKESEGASETDGLLSSEKPRAAVIPDVENGHRKKEAAVVSALHRETTTSAATSNCSGDSKSKSPDKVVTVCGALEYVQRDAFESYLFLREFMSTCSKAWSFTILLFAFLAVFFTIIFLLGAISHAKVISDIDWAFYTIWTTIRIVLLIVYPVTSLAHANVYVYALEEQFLVAAPEDFAVIGGRDSWLEYLQKVPAMWMIYGIAVSWDRLSGLLWTGIAGIGALALSSAFSTN
jgi:hypothetical protein